MELTKNLNHGKFNKPIGYKDLGWQIHVGNSHDLKLCKKQGHLLKTYDNSHSLGRGSHIIYRCDQCKFIFHIDMSD
jgi:hypothetical protein